MGAAAESVMADGFYLAVGILLALAAITGKASAGAPETPPIQEEIDSAKPPGRVARVFFAVLGMVLILYSMRALLIKLR